MVAVEVVGGGCLERYHHPARQCGAGCECVAYAVAVECRIGKRVEQSVFVAIEAAFVVVGVKVGECGGELQPTAGVAYLLGGAPSHAALALGAVGHTHLCLRGPSSALYAECSLCAVGGIVVESRMGGIVLLPQLDAVARLPCEQPTAILYLQEIVRSVRGKGHAVAGPGEVGIVGIGE